MLTVDTTNSLVDEASLVEFADTISRELIAMQCIVDEGDYDDDYASLNLPNDVAMVARVKELAAKFSSVETVLLIGMGGPGLGAKAAQEALSGVLHNELRSPRIYYADTVDPHRISDLGAILDRDLTENKRILVIVSTQSGTTAESIANLQYFGGILDAHQVDRASSMIVITNVGSKLAAFAADRSIEQLLIPPKVGGRYSALSPLGLFPLAVLGFDIEALVSGALQARKECLVDSIEENPAARNAATLFHHFRAGKHIVANFMSGPELESLGLWSRQVMAESLGKAKNKYDQTVNVGITPSVLVGSRDLHSMFQLAMEGPDNTYTCFVQSISNGTPTIPAEPSDINMLTPHLVGKSYQQLTDAINQGVVYAYKEAERPFSLIDLGQLDEHSLGWYLQVRMMETMFLGSLLTVNPFDQPGVENYKAETKRILTNG